MWKKRAPRVMFVAAIAAGSFLAIGCDRRSHEVDEAAVLVTPAPEGGERDDTPRRVASGAEPADPPHVRETPEPTRQGEPAPGRRGELALMVEEDRVTIGEEELAALADRALSSQEGRELARQALQRREGADTEGGTIRIDESSAERQRRGDAPRQAQSRTPGQRVPAVTRARYPREQLEAVREREVAIGRVERGPGQNVAPRRTTPTYESTYRPGAYGVDAASRAYSTGQTPAFDAPSQSAADLTYQSGELPDRATPPTERAADARPERTTPPTGRAPETSPPQAPAGGQPVEDTTSRAPLGGDVPSNVPAANTPARAPMSPQIP